MFNGAFDYLCWIFNFHFNKRETHIALKYVSVCKLWISCKLFLPFVHNVRYKNINLIKTPEHKKKKFHEKQWWKSHGRNLVIDLFTAPKCYILQPKSKNFLCKGGSAPLAPPRRRNLLRRFRGLCVNSATFWKSATFAFILPCHKKPGRNPGILGTPNLIFQVCILGSPNLIFQVCILGTP